MMLKKHRRLATVLAVAGLITLGLAGYAATTAIPARAASYIARTVAGSPSRSLQSTDGTQPVITVESSSVGSFQFHFRGTILIDVHLKGTQRHSPKCGWANGYNGYAMVNGHWVYRFERHVHYCPNKNSPTGFAKIGGGDTGRDCGNPFKPGHHAPGRVFRGKFTELTRLNVHKVVKAMAYAMVKGECPNIDVGGEASASSMVSQVIDSKLLVEAQGKASRLKAIVTEDLREKGVVKATAKLHLDCNVPPPTTTTQTTTTQTTTTTTTTTPTTTTTVPPPSITITSFINLNQVPAGDNSGQLPFTVNASDPGGSVTVSPDLGGVSNCNSSTPQSSVTYSLTAGNNNKCVIYYAPNDADQPPSDTITYTATLTTAGGTAHDQKVDTVAITYPVRP